MRCEKKNPQKTDSTTELGIKQKNNVKYVSDDPIPILKINRSSRWPTKL